MGRGVCPKFESFVGNLEGFAPPGKSEFPPLRMCSHCLFPACRQVANNGLLTTCYKVVELNRLVTGCSNNLLSSCNSTICQQVVSDNFVATWWNNSIATISSQACYYSLLRTHLVDKLWDFYVCTHRSLMILSDLLQGCSNKSDTVMI